MQGCEHLHAFHLGLVVGDSVVICQPELLERWACMELAIDVPRDGLPTILCLIIVQCFGGDLPCDHFTRAYNFFLVIDNLEAEVI